MLISTDQDPIGSAEAEPTIDSPKVMGIPVWLAWNPSPFKVNLEPGKPVGLAPLMAGVTVKSALAPFPLGSLATMDNRPPGAVGMVRSADQTP